MSKSTSHTYSGNNLYRQSDKNSSIGNASELLEMYRRITLSLTHNHNTTIQFIGVDGHENASHTIINFAEIIAAKVGASVLVLNCKVNFIYYKPIAMLPGYEHYDLYEWNNEVDKAIYRVGTSRLFVSPFSLSIKDSKKFSNRASCDIFLDKIKSKYDFILIDSCHFLNYSESLSICSKVDGVVIVFEAGHTNIDMASIVKNKIINAGGKVLGFIFNNYHSYAPSIS